MLPTRINRQGKEEIFDRLRKSWVRLTPEERVRQYFVDYLINIAGYPMGRIGNEVSIELNGTVKRCDSVVYDVSGMPLAIIEYKAPDVKITRATFEQIMRYAIALRTPWLIVSNGLNHFCAFVEQGEPPRLKFLEKFPGYDELCGKQ